MRIAVVLGCAQRYNIIRLSSLVLKLVILHVCERGNIMDKKAKKTDEIFNNIETDSKELNKALVELGLKGIISRNNNELVFNASNPFIKEILDNVPGGIAICEIDDEVNPLYVNESVLHMFGYSKFKNGKSKQHKNISALEDDLKKLIKDINNALIKNNPIESILRVKNEDDSLSYMLVKGAKIGNKNGNPVIISIIVDITKEINIENDLKYRINYDSLTDMYNKDEFYKKTQDMLLNNIDKEYDIISLNIDRFKLINDLFGMEEGDKLLKYISDMLKKEVDFTYETCGRLYADNFAICKLREEGYEENLVESLKKYLSLYPLDLNISMCFGIYRVDSRDISVVSMCDRANMALKNIKGSYKKIYAYYEETHRNALLEEQEIINDMNNALKNEEFEVYFQPKYVLSNIKLTGAEALVRWRHPKKGMISPTKFIPVFEKSGFIITMDEYVWEFTCKKIREWLDLGLSVVPISVNVSRVDIYNPKLCENLKGLLDKYNIPINLLELEITETAYTENPAQLIEAVSKLKKLGFTVEMDDFGTGYSSLNMLNQVPVDVLKLDLRFLKSTKFYGRSANILNSVVSMAKWLNLPVVAEGIETKEQVAFLKSIGCNKGQGFYFAKPMPYNQFEELLYNSDNSDNFEDNDLSESFVDIEEFWNPNSQVNVLFNSFVGGLGIFELKGRSFDILRVNDRFYEIMNLDRDTIYNISPRLKEYIVKEDKYLFFKKLEQAKSEKGETIIETRLINPKTNELMYILFRMRVILNNPERTLFLGSVDNFTNQKIAQNKLKSNDERYEHVMELTEDIIFEYDMITMKIICSSNLKKKFGKIPVRASWMQSVIDSGIIQDKDIEEFSSLFRKIKYENVPSITAKYQVKNSKNQYIWCIISAKGVYDKKNKLIKIVGIISDVEAMRSRLGE